MNNSPTYSTVNTNKDIYIWVENDNRVYIQTTTDIKLTSLRMTFENNNVHNAQEQWKADTIINALGSYPWTVESNTADQIEFLYGNTNKSIDVTTKHYYT